MAFLGIWSNAAELGSCDHYHPAGQLDFLDAGGP